MQGQEGMLDRPPPGGIVGLVMAGTGPAVAATFTNPLDVARVNMQLNGEGGGAAAHRNTLACIRSIFAKNGIVGIQRGLTTAYFREFIQNAPRLGLFEPLVDVYRKAEGTYGNGLPSSFAARFFAGASCGVIGGVFSNPGEIVKARVQSGRYQYGHPFNPMSPFVGLANMAKEEGVLSWFKGADASAVRCFVGTSSQMLTASYVLDIIKLTPWYNDPATSLSAKSKFAIAHCVSGLASGCVLSCAMQPFDTARTRLYSQPTNTDGSGKLYRTGVTGLMDAMHKTFRLEGLRGLYKGLTGNIIRQGPHMALAFLILSQFKQLYGHSVFRPREINILWKELDRNCDGYLDVDEIKSFLRQYYSEKEDTVVDEGELEKSAQRMLRFADLNRDGKVSRDEFDELVSDLEYVVRGNLIGYWAHLAITS